VATSHGFETANGIKVHFVRCGSGTPLLLLHGWPEFWRIWRKVIEPLGETFEVVAPDLRGFGETEKPEASALDAYTLQHHVDDLLGVVEALQWPRFGIVSHDVGAYVAQTFARAHSDRLLGLFFFDCPYPGIGKRWADPGHLREIWYQTFNQQPWAAELVASSREACRIYIGHFLSHWAHHPQAFDPEDVAAWVDNYLEPGNLQGGFNWYIAANEARLELIRHGPPQLPAIDVPTRVRWGVSDKVLKVEWGDRLHEYFSDCDFAPVEGAGHFVPYERPTYAVSEIRDFFAGLGSGAG
jgi:pimeloyl-ACP methyl ester carboxylesterase